MYEWPTVCNLLFGNHEQLGDICDLLTVQNWMVFPVPANQNVHISTFNHTFVREDDTSIDKYEHILTGNEK
jgi:hypothetical protein